MIGAGWPAEAVGPRATLQHAAGTRVEQRVLAITPEFY